MRTGRLASRSVTAQCYLKQQSIINALTYLIIYDPIVTVQTADTKGKPMTTKIGSLTETSMPREVLDAIGGFDTLVREVWPRYLESEAPQTLAKTARPAAQQLRSLPIIDGETDFGMLTAHVDSICAQLRGVPVAPIEYADASAEQRMKFSIEARIRPLKETLAWYDSMSLEPTAAGEAMTALLDIAKHMLESASQLASWGATYKRFVANCGGRRRPARPAPVVRVRG